MFCRQNPGIFFANAASSGFCRHKQMADPSGLVADPHHAVHNVFGIMQIKGPAVFTILQQFFPAVFRGECIQIKCRTDLFANGISPFGKKTSCLVPLVIGFHKAHVFAPLPLGQFGQRMCIAPLLVEVRAAQSGTGTALRPAPGVDLLVVPCQEHRRYGAALPHFGPGILRVFQQAVPVTFILVAFFLGQNAVS